MLNGNVQIPSDSSLTIRPGVMIVFDNDFQILVKGRLHVQGTRWQPVEFFGNRTGKSMILFKSTNLSNSVITNTHFFGPKPAIQLAEEGEHSQDTIKNWGTLQLDSFGLFNSKIQTNGYGSKASLSILDAYISQSTIVGVYPRSEPISISNTIIERSIISSESYNYGIKIQTSTLTDSNLTIGCCQANIEVIESKMTNMIVREGSGSPVMGPFTIDRCTVNGLSINLPSARVSLKSSRIRLSEKKSITVGIANVTCTTIIGDKTQNGLVIMGKYGYDQSSIPQIISDSSISNLLTAISVTGSKTVLKIDRTNLFANDQYNIYSTSKTDIDAKNNYWGSHFMDRSAAKLYDYYQDIEYGQILMEPFATSRIDNNVC